MYTLDSNGRFRRISPGSMLRSERSSPSAKEYLHMNGNPSKSIVSQNQEVTDDSSASKAEEWLTHKRVEVKTTKQIETKVKRQIVLEDGEIIQDSGPTITSDIVTDTTKEELEASEHMQNGNVSPERRFAAHNNESILTEKRERTMSKREEAEEKTETREVKHLGDLSHEEFLRLVQCKKNDSEQRKDHSPPHSSSQSSSKTVIHHSSKLKKFTDEENIHKKSVNGSDLLNERQTTSEKLVHNSEKVSDDASSAEERETESKFYKIRQSRDEDVVEYVGIMSPLERVKLGEGRRGISENVEEEKFEDKEKHTRRSSGCRSDEKRAGKLRDTDKAFASLQHPFYRMNHSSQFDIAEQSRKRETSEWLDSHFGSMDSIYNRFSFDEFGVKEPANAVYGGNNIHISMLPTKSARSTSERTSQQPIVSHPVSPSPFKMTSKDRVKETSNRSRNYEITEMPYDFVLKSRSTPPFSSERPREKTPNTLRSSAWERHPEIRSSPWSSRSKIFLTKDEEIEGKLKNASLFSDDPLESRYAPRMSDEWSLGYSKELNHQSDSPVSSAPIHYIPINRESSYTNGKTTSKSHLHSDFKSLSPLAPRRDKAHKEQGKSRTSFAEKDEFAHQSSASPRSHSSYHHGQHLEAKHEKVHSDSYGEYGSFLHYHADVDDGKAPYASGRSEAGKHRREDTKEYFTVDKKLSNSSKTRVHEFDKSQTLPRKLDDKSPAGGSNLPRFYFGDVRGNMRKTDNKSRASSASKVKVGTSRKENGGYVPISRSQSFNFLKKYSFGSKDADCAHSPKHVKQESAYIYHTMDTRKGQEARGDTDRKILEPSSKQPIANREHSSPWVQTPKADPRTSASSKRIQAHEEESSSKRNRFLRSLLKSAPDLFSHLHNGMEARSPKQKEQTKYPPPSKHYSAKFLESNGEYPIPPPRKKHLKAASQQQHAEKYSYATSISPQASPVGCNRNSFAKKQRSVSCHSDDSGVTSPLHGEKNFCASPEGASVSCQSRLRFNAPLYKKFSQMKEESKLSQSTPNLMEDRSWYKSTMKTPLRQQQQQQQRLSSTSKPNPASTLHRSQSLLNDSRIHSFKSNYRNSPTQGSRVRTLYNITVPAPQKARSMTPESASSSTNHKHSFLSSSKGGSIDRRVSSVKTRTHTEESECRSPFRPEHTYVAEKTSPSPFGVYKSAMMAEE